MTDASAVNPGHTNTRPSPGAGQHGLEVPSENTGNDSFESTGSRCLEGDGKGRDRCDYGGQGSNDQIAWTSAGGAVDLDELADRVSDALVSAVSVDGDVLDSTPSPPGSTPPGYSAQAASMLRNQGEQERGDVQAEGVAEAAQQPDNASHEAALELGVGGTCGEGEHQRICNQDEECCNSSCGICAPRGHSCLQIACGALSRGGGSKVRLCPRM